MEIINHEEEKGTEEKGNEQENKKKKKIEIEGGITIENIVATAEIAENIDLGRIVMAFEGAKYDQHRFPGLIYKDIDLNVSVLIFRSGTMNITGVTNMEDLQNMVDMVLQRLRSAGVKVNEKPEVKVMNIVALATVSENLDLPRVAMGMGLENIEYEPEQFPGLVYRQEKMTFLLFSSGRVVCTGAQEIQEIPEGVRKLKETLNMFIEI